MRALLAIVSILFVGAGCAQQAPSRDSAQPSTLSRPAPRPPEYPAPRVEAPDRELRARAMSQLRTSLSSASAFSRAHAVEASRYLPADLAREAVLAGASDNAGVVRFAAMMIAGELRIADAKPVAQRLLQDRDRNVQAAAIFALHRMGDKRFSKQLEQFAIDPDRQLRGNTALLLGMMQEPSAAVLLRRQMRDHDEVIRLQAAEGLWRLEKSSDALEYLVTATISRYPDDQMIAATALAGARDPRIAEHVRAMLTTNYAEVNLVAARAMGMLGMDEGYGVATSGARSKDPRQRQLAAAALGAIGRMDAQGMLGKLLTDTDEDVRIAAAGAILQLR